MILAVYLDHRWASSLAPSIQISAEVLSCNSTLVFGKEYAFSHHPLLCPFLPLALILNDGNVLKTISAFLLWEVAVGLPFYHRGCSGDCKQRVHRMARAKTPSCKRGISHERKHGGSPVVLLYMISDPSLSRLIFLVVETCWTPCLVTT